MKRTKLNSMHLLAFGILFASFFVISACNNQPEEETTEEPEEAYTAPAWTPTPPPPQPRADISSKAKETETPEEYHDISDDEVYRYDRDDAPPVVFVPHRITYVDLEDDDKPLKERMAAFDVPPIYSGRCKRQESPQLCSQEEVQQYFDTNIRFPKEANEMDKPVEYVTFLVDVDGKIDKDNILVMPQTPQCRTCAAEALRLIRSMPRWEPAEKNGAPVAAKVTVPVKFVASSE